MRRRPARAVGGGVALVAIVGAAILVRGRGGQSVAEQRALFAQLPVFPGAVKIIDEDYSIAQDSGPATRAARIVFRLPPAVSAADVLGFYRSGKPTGWTEPSDEFCRRQLAVMPEVDPATVRLLHQRTQLTLFAPGGGPAMIYGTGVNVTLGRDGADKLVRLDVPVVSCGVPEADFDVTNFDG